MRRPRRISADRSSGRHGIRVGDLHRLRRTASSPSPALPAGECLELPGRLFPQLRLFSPTPHVGPGGGRCACLPACRPPSPAAESPGGALRPRDRLRVEDVPLEPPPPPPRWLLPCRACRAARGGLRWSAERSPRGGAARAAGRRAPSPPGGLPGRRFSRPSSGRRGKFSRAGRVGEVIAGALSRSSSGWQEGSDQSCRAFLARGSAPQRTPAMAGRGACVPYLADARSCPAGPSEKAALRTP